MQDMNARKFLWLTSDVVTDEDKNTIIDMDETQLTNCFYRQLAFGTGGLRGEIGMGDDRMNLYTVRHATRGLADYLLSTTLPRKVAIAHDSRIMSREFAEAAALVLAEQGITALMYPRLEPTPALSFAVRDQGCGAGICITASHNPAKYNGYKVYGADGCQITTEAANAIQQCITAAPMFVKSKLTFEEAKAQGLIRDLPEDLLDRFLQAVEGEQLRPELNQVPLKVVYTPLNGTGLECVTRMLRDCGITDVHVVAEQEHPDGHFPTCPYPNPEIREALALGIRDCKAYQPDLLLATDPDCDRVGIALPVGDDVRLMTGNEVGILLMDYIAKTRMEKGTMPLKPVVVTTIVSSAMADKVAEHYGIELRRTLTGFKFIGEQIGLLEKAGQKARYLFGFEESYGYLSGTHARDKDAVNASLLICEMARYYKQQGMTLPEAMDSLYQTYGYHFNSLHSYTFEGAKGMTVMGEKMTALRTNPPKTIAGAAVTDVKDYLSQGTGLPAADVLTFCLDGGDKVIIRPSGTEPKIKAYTFTKAPDESAAKAREAQLGSWLDEMMRG